MRPETQRGFSLDHLTDSELIELIQKKYDRLPRTEKWLGSVETLPAPVKAQRTLFSEEAA